MLMIIDMVPFLVAERHETQALLHNISNVKRAVTNIPPRANILSQARARANCGQWS